jgi:hypothetical protein
MADRELAIKVTAVIGEFLTGMQKVVAETKEMGAQVTETFSSIEERAEHMNGLWTAMFEAFAAAEIVEGFKKIAEASNEASDALEIAANTAKNLGKSFDVEEVGAWIKRFAASAAGGGYAISSMRNAMQQFASVGADGAQSERLLAVAANLAAARHLDLAEATHIVTLAASGHVAMLGRYGINVKDAQGKTISFTQAIERMEAAFSGDAEKRANGLEGAFGRLTNAGNNFAVVFGAALIPYLEAGANALTNLTNAAAQLPQGFLAAVAAAGAVIGTLTVAALVLPAVAKGFAIITDAIDILVVPFAAVGKVALGVASIAGETLVPALGRVAAAMLGPLVAGARAAIASFMELAAALAAPMLEAIGGVIAGFASAAAAAIAAGVAALAAWLAPIAPIVAVVAAIALVIGVIALAVTHWSQISTAAKNALDFIGGALQKFVSFAADQFGALRDIFAGVWEYLSGNEEAGLGLMEQGWSHVRAGWTGVGVAIGTSLKSGFESASKWAETHFPQTIAFIKNQMKSLFGGAGGGVDLSKADLSGLGGPEAGAGGDQKGINKGINNALTAQRDAIDQLVARYSQLTAQARAHLAAASEAVSLYDKQLSLIKEQDRTAADYEQKERLLAAEAKAQNDLAYALSREKAAHLAAAAAEAAMADHLSAADKDRVAHAKELTDAAQRHRLEAERLAQAYGEAQAKVAQMKIDVLATMIAEQDSEDQRALREGKIGLDVSEAVQKAALEAKLQDVDYRQGMAKAKGKGEETAGQSTEFDVERDRIAAELAELAVAIAQKRLEIENEHGSDESRAAAFAQLQAATTSLTAAQNKLDVAIATHVQAMQTATKGMVSLNTVIADLVNKSLGKLGVSAKVDPNTQKLAVSFDPMTLLLNVIEQTKAFGDIINVVTAIVKVLAEIFDGVFKPAIDAVLHAIIFLVNGIISFVDIFGLHIQHLSQNLDDLNGAVEPLITVFRNLPTLNDLATGNTGNLGTKTTSNTMDGMINSVAGSPIIASAVAAIAASAALVGGASANPLVAAAAATSSSSSQSVVVNIGTVQMPAGQSAQAMGESLGETVIQRTRNMGYTLDRVPGAR